MTSGGIQKALRPDERGLGRAAEALRRGELVVFPTETVYGLGANALDACAVSGIFAAKGRPADNPLIIHVADVAGARRLVRSWPEQAEALAKAFWPGPLTLVLPRAEGIPELVTAGLDSVAVRVPGHPVARALIERAGVPVAAPSANLSGRPSPTRVEHAIEDLGARVAVFLDGGPTEVGLESTVVALLGQGPMLLRPGGIGVEALERVVGPVVRPKAGEPVRSPGMKYRHYAPKARLFLERPEGIERRCNELRREGVRVAVIASREGGLEGEDVRVPGGREEPEAWARALFALLRELDGQGYGAIVVEQIPENGLGLAVLNRLRKAAEG